MTASRTRSQTSKSSLGSWDDRTIRDYRKFYLFITIMVALIIAVGGGYIYTTLGDDDDEGPADTVSLNCYNDDHTVTPNGTTQFVFVLENTADSDDRNFINLAVTEQPEGWNVRIDQETSMLYKGGREIRFLTVTGPEGIDSGSFTIELTATSLTFGGDSDSDKVRVRPIPQTSNKVVESGDNLITNYVGYLADGKIFDTSVESVAKSGVPKTSDFQVRDSYSEFGFTADNGDVIPGFDAGVMGMSLHETKIIIVPPDQGYTQEGHALYGKTLYFELKLEKFE